LQDLTPLPFPSRPLTDGVVALRAAREGDPDVFAAMGDDPEIARWITLPPGYDAQQARAFARETEQARLEGRKLFLVIVDAVTGDVLGDCEVNLAGDDPRVGELGYALLAHARGRGHATRTVRLLAAYAAETLGMTRVQACVHPDNAPSRRVLERAGFTAEGLLRDHRGPGEDRVMYAIAASSPGRGRRARRWWRRAARR
jgi:RimJ/RimL family protein N-acetyltransferase